ncbi:MAG: SPOR domain-containing protein [Pseudomonadota bacterium]
MKHWRWITALLVVLNLVLIGLKRIEPPLPEVVPAELVQPGDRSIELVHEVWPGGDERATRCYTLGPLPTLVQQSRAEDRLLPFATEIRMRQTTADRDRGWWVFLVAGDRASALAMAQDLARRGVEDYFVVADQNQPDAVSLGLFERRDNARQRLAQIRAMGLDAQLAVRREDAPQFWIDYSIEPDRRSPWRFIARSSPEARQFEIPCF